MRFRVVNRILLCYNFFMDYARVKSYAKINLSLDITGVSGGYHSLDSVVVTVDIADVIAVKKRKKDKLVSITMHGRGSESIPFEGNNAVKAAQAFISRYDTCGVDITVFKNIPMGAGLGGSSADVSGTLRALERLFAIDDCEGVKGIADGIGSDCGYMLYGGYARLKGRGDDVELIDSSLALDIGLLVPKSGVSTAQCYSKFDELARSCGNSGDGVSAAVISGDKYGLGRNLHNDLYAPATMLNPSVGSSYDELLSFAPLGVSMTGSGSAVFAIFENDSFARYAQSRYRGDSEFILTKTKLPRREDKNGRRKTY